MAEPRPAAGRRAHPLVRDVTDFRLENPLTGEARHTSSAYLTMVAIDEQGRPTLVPPLVAGSPTEQRRAREAELRRVNRLAEREQIITERDG